STGIKFWRHQEQLYAYKDVLPGTPRCSVISTHISPEGKCNLKCPYCSVTYRDTHSRIALPKIKKYVVDLKNRGLKAVILTGGGEPTLYPKFNELVQWLKHDMGLSVALITNGTTSNRIEPETLRCFSWIRVSVNIFSGWVQRIKLDLDNLNPDCVVGCSMVYTVEHEASDELLQDRLELFSKVSKVADSCNAKYIRLLPNCLLEQKQLIVEHRSLQNLVSQLGDSRYFQQYKIHGAPSASICHQAYFRPYLSEEPWHEDGEPGTVYPCDSVVLNDSLAHFAKRYQVCKSEDVLDFIDGKIGMQFCPKEHCKGCVFTDSVNMLKQWKEDGINRFDEFPSPLVHEEFV
ncbi:MAG TPA: radical SAM protein, partial [Dehalococcoidia bacterium]|nr:radical SAM protein [Dehalococcoidia bacterium]